MVLCAQALSPESPGWHLYSASGDASYYSVGLPYGYGALPAGVTPQPAWSGGAGASAGWSEFREASSAMVSYIGSYQAESGYSGFRAWNQSLSAGWQKKLRPRWDWSLIASAGVASRDQYLFSSITLDDVPSIQEKPEDLPTGPLGGGYPGGQPGFGVSPNPALEPLAEVLFGNRLLTTQLTSRLTYQQSERLSWRFTLSGVQMEGLPDSSASDDGGGSLLSTSTSAAADVRVKYLLSPRTALTFEVSETRTVSRIEDVYTTLATAGIIHKLSQRWVSEVYAGASRLSPLRETYPLTADLGYVSGGSLAFKSFSHTLEGSVSRQMGDSYGLGALNSLVAKGTWIWRRPGNAWWLESIFSWQKLSEGVSVADWSATAAVNRVLSPHFTAQTAYVYLRFSESGLPGVLPAQSSLRASIVWFPREIYR
jgi:hypothetical protein